VRRYFPAVVLGLALLWLASSWRQPRVPSADFDLVAFGKTPVLVGGRVKPLDTVARNSLLIIHSKQKLRLADGGRIDAMRWLTDTLFAAPVADQHPAFVIQNDEVLGLFGWQQSDRKYFSYAELKPFLRQIEEQGARRKSCSRSSARPFKAQS